MKKICLFCRESYFYDFDKYGFNRGLKCGPANMKVGSQTEGLVCFQEDSPEKIANKKKEYTEIFGKNDKKLI